MDPAAAAKAADLHYVGVAQPGIQRRRSGRGFSYMGPDRQTIRDRATLARIRSLVIPPAWTDVWICASPNGHIQATGRDARGRKQYRYHPRWHQSRDETKYERMILFGHALPALRERATEDLALPGLPRKKLLATIVLLLETTMMRVGNEEYARDNGSFGLTTLQNRHVQVEGPDIRFNFRGKSGKVHKIRVTDRRLARLVKRCRDLPGQDLFQYLDEQGEVQPIRSDDVNEYLGTISGEDFTAKDFRTWAGTLLAAQELAKFCGTDSATEAKAAALQAVQAAATQLGNTVAICRKCYIHPAVLGAFSDPALLDLWRKATEVELQPGLDPEESALLAFLEAAAAKTERREGE